MQLRRLVVRFLEDLDDFEWDVPECATDLALCDTLCMFLAVGVENIHLQRKADECRLRSDEGGVERLAAGGTTRRADLDLYVLHVRCIQSLSCLTHGDADGVVDSRYVANEPGSFHRNEIVAHTRSS